MYLIVERFLQEYKEPTEDGVAPSTLPVSTDDVLLQLPEGTLVKNLGVPIIVVCCKVSFHYHICLTLD
jgi:hypothetical protein